MRGEARFTVPPVPSDLLPAMLKSPVPFSSPPASSHIAAPAAQLPPMPSGAARHPVHPIDRERLHRAGMVCPEGGVSAQVEEFRIVKRRLIEQMAERAAGGQEEGDAARRMMVTSPHPGEGKTFCAVNLALSIAAERDSEVLLVDCDLARASVLDLLGLPAGPGLMDALADPAIDVLDHVMATDIPRLFVLPGGTPTGADAEYLSAARAAHVLDRLTQGAPNRIVLFDTPPVLAASIPVELAKLMGQAVLVVRADTTPQGAVEDAVSLLSPHPGARHPSIQLLLNAVSFSPSGRRFGTYYGGAR